jgi:hypothetical protein
MRRRIRDTALGAAGALWLACSAALPAAADGEVEILVLKEHGVGSPTLAQPYVDRFVAVAAQQNDWPAAKGQYFSTRSAAETYLASHQPHYGILSLAAFLALRKPHKLEVIGRVASTLAGGEQYFVVSKSATDLAGCKGQVLASDHTSDAQFVERVVARGDFKLADFKLLQNQRPLQSLKQLLGGEATCALIDDAQLGELQHLDGASAVREVWRSRKLPPMVVVAFPVAPAAERKAFQASLDDVCDEAGHDACAEIGIHMLDAASPDDYAEVVAAYGH